MARLGGGGRKLVKRGRSQLKIDVRTVNSYHGSEFHPNCEDTIRITFVTHTHRRFLPSSTSSLIGEELVVTGQNYSISPNRHDFFRENNASDSYSYSTISESLRHMNIKGDHDKIISLVLRFGQRMSKKKKKKDFKGLVVIMTTIKTFVGDAVSIHEALMKLDREREAYLRQQGLNVVHVS